MALMFTRLARNFIKNGYFPTDEDTLTRVLSALQPSGTQRPLRILDPCCGEGSALAEVQELLTAQGAPVESFGIEYNEERAWHAKQLLHRCIHADMHDCNVSLKAFGLLWLNPPYGDLLSDSERSTAGHGAGRQRLEKIFAQRCFPLLQPGGVLVLIVPYTVLDKAFATLIARHFHRIQVYAAPEQRFCQAVILGVKQARCAEADNTVVQRILNAQKNRYLNATGEYVEGFVTDCVLPEIWRDAPYEVPAVHNESEPVKFHVVRLDERQLKAEIDSSPLLWDRFETLFRGQRALQRAPLRKLSSWHLALMLAAGQIAGVVKSRDDRIWVVKGDTFKAKSMREESEVNQETGEVSLVRTATDRFVPMIRALDFTPASQTFGRALRIE